jgi:hypothetical protein
MPEGGGINNNSGSSIGIMSINMSMFIAARNNIRMNTAVSSSMSATIGTRRAR